MEVTEQNTPKELHLNHFDLEHQNFYLQAIKDDMRATQRIYENDVDQKWELMAKKDKRDSFRECININICNIVNVAQFILILILIHKFG